MHPWLAAFPLRVSGIGTVHCIIAAQVWVSGITSTIKQWLTGIVPDESVDAILGTRSSRHSAACVLVYY